MLVGLLVKWSRRIKKGMYVYVYKYSSSVCDFILPSSCKAEGRSETQPGRAQADAVCGPPVSGKTHSSAQNKGALTYKKMAKKKKSSGLCFLAGAAPSWVIVPVLSVITVLCPLILLLFCYKDKLKLLSSRLY